MSWINVVENLSNVKYILKTISKDVLIDKQPVKKATN